jgi:hypothetical protein
MAKQLNIIGAGLTTRKVTWFVLIGMSSGVSAGLVDLTLFARSRALTVESRERNREIVESPFKQGPEEEIHYTHTTTPWGSNPSGVSVKIYDSNGVDQSATLLSGSASVVGDVITTPAVIGLTLGQKYRLEIKYTCSGNVFEAYGTIWGERILVVESPITQGKDEEIAYTLTTTPWGSSPASVSVKIYDSSGVDQSATCLTGSESAVADVITMPVVHTLTAGEIYRLNIEFMIGTDKFVPCCMIHAEE